MHMTSLFIIYFTSIVLYDDNIKHETFTLLKEKN